MVSIHGVFRLFGIDALVSSQLCVRPSGDRWRQTLIAGSRVCIRGSTEGRIGHYHHGGSTYPNRMVATSVCGRRL
jgi:hypothetical protein